MKESLKLTLSAVLVLLLAVSCNKHIEPDNSFVNSSDIQLIVKGTVQCTYDPQTWQLGYNPSNLEFRMSDDQMKSWCYVTCSEQPRTTGQTLEAEVEWSIYGKKDSVKGKFEVVKAKDNTFWLWCGSKSKQVAVTVSLLR